MRRPIRATGGLAIISVIAVIMAGCNGPDEGPKAAPTSPGPAATSSPAETPVRDMKPADPKPDDAKAAPAPKAEARPSDEPPPLVPPAGAKDEQPDAKPK